MKKSYEWDYHCPGMIYSGKLYFEKAVTESEARKELRKEYECKKLPNNTAFWIQSAEDKKIIAESLKNSDFINY